MADHRAATLLIGPAVYRKIFILSVLAEESSEFEVWHDITSNFLTKLILYEYGVRTMTLRLCSSKD